MSDGTPQGPTVLLSSAGRRVELLRAFRRSPGTRVLTTDCSWYSSAFHEADEAFLVPRCSSPEFVPRMLELCAAHQVDLLVPTIDPELPIYAAARDRFAEVGTTVAVSSPEVVKIAADKQRTHDWLTAEGFPTVAQAGPDEVRAHPEDWPFPLVVKPRSGSASIGVATVHDRAQLDHALGGTLGDHGGAARREMIVQQLAAGTEYTIDALVLGGTVAAAVPRRRIEVRAGEVAKAVTARSPELIELTEKLCARLPGAYGPLNVQVFAGDGPNQLAVIEINARFGGGFPLSFAAGADMPLALLQEALHLPVTAVTTAWRDDLVMLRYDAAVFVDGSTQLTKQP